MAFRVLGQFLLSKNLAFYIRTCRRATCLLLRTKGAILKRQCLDTEKDTWLVLQAAVGDLYAGNTGRCFESIKIHIFHIL